MAGCLFYTIMNGGHVKLYYTLIDIIANIEYT